MNLWKDLIFMKPNDMPVQTRASIASDLQRLGVRDGQLLMVHSSLKSVGYALGGAPTVVRALIDVLGAGGTLTMPAFSPEVSDPASWGDRPFGGNDLELAQDHVPVFDVAVTPTSMGAIAETFRSWPGVLRSVHPQVSVTARGPLAERIVAPHELAWGQGAGSPFERLYELDAALLLLGVGFNRATFLHFAESRVPHGRRKTRRIPVDRDGGRTWLPVPDVGDDLNTYFPRIGEEFLKTGRASTGLVGQAPSTLVSSRALVDFARDFLARTFDKSSG
jgi:aminoglycoside 3-N-acetyltransferase